MTERYELSYISHILNREVSVVFPSMEGIEQALSDLAEARRETGFEFMPRVRVI